MGNYSEYTTKIFLNDNEAENKLTKLKDRIKQLRDEKAKALNAGDMSSFKKAEKNIRACEKEMKALSTTSQSVDKVLSNLSDSSIKDIQRTIKAINKELSDGSIERNTNEWKFLNEQLKRAKDELRAIKGESEEASSEGFFDNAVDHIKKSWKTITKIGVGITLASKTIAPVIRDYAQLEQEMANVRKYTGQTAEEVKRMNEDFKKVNTRTSQEELNHLAGAAGRLGITSTKAVEEFVDAADKINVALGDDLGEGAVDKIGKLAMAFGEDDRLGLRGAMLATGSAINELAQNSSANAGYLVEFTARLSGVGQQAGLTQAQIMSFGAVLDENMQKDEMAATALSQLITKMVTEPAKFAKLAGQDVADFSKLIREDMNGALMKLFETLNSKGGFDKLAPMFADMGLDGTRATQVLSVMADKIDDVKERQQLANKAYREATSVTKEFDIQNNTVQANLEKTGKQLKTLSYELGEKLLPVVNYAIKGGELLLKASSAIINFIKNNKGIITGLITTLVVLNAKKLINIATDKIWAAGTVALNTVIKTLWTTLTKNPLGIIAAAIGVVVGVMMKWRDEQARIKAEAEELNKVEEDAVKTYSESAAHIKMLETVMRDEKVSIDNRRKALEELKEIIPDYNGMLDEEGRLTRDNKKAIDEYLISLEKEIKLKVYKDKLEELYKRRSDLEDEKNEKQNKLEKKKGGNQPLASQEGYAIKLMRKLRLTEEQRLQKDVDETGKQLFMVDMKIDQITKKIGAVGGKIEKTTSPAKNNPDDKDKNKDSNSDYKSGKEHKEEERQRKKLEAENRKREAAALKAKRDRDKQEKAETEARLATLTTEYSQGKILYSDYIKQRDQLQLDSLNRRKKIWGEESDEAKQLAMDEVRIQQKHNEEMVKLREEDIENSRVATEAKIKAQFYDKNSEIFLNEDALNEALYENEMSALADRIAANLEGTEEWFRLKAELEQRELDHQVEQQQYYNEKIAQYRKQWAHLDVSQEQQITLNGFEDLYKKKLIAHEQYEQMKLNITKRYAAMQADADAYEYGPGSKERKFNEDVQTKLNQAKAKAGDQSKGENSNVLDYLFVNDFKNWKATNDMINQMEQDQVMTHAEANAAKALNDAEYFESLANKAQFCYDQINTILSAASSYTRACSDLEVARINANYDKQIEAAGKNSKKRERLEKERDAKIAKAKSKANKKAMKIEIAQAFASTALAAINAYAATAKIPIVGPTLAPIAAAVATAAGMLQIAAIKKQHQAEAAGYYEGGFTGGKRYRQTAGVVHEGEFVANHLAVGNPNILPALQLIDRAQRNNTVASLTSSDLNTAIGGGNPSVVAPVVNVMQDTEQQHRIETSINQLDKATSQLNDILQSGIYAKVSIDGEDGVYRGLQHYKKLRGNR